ncbi:MAG: hypothetical protein PF518_18770 [Spirochaetaceae bacterium]|jgi:hypothetical protein|nr:hypothetical protein [Spirochaetaceae bacterium]
MSCVRDDYGNISVADEITCPHCGYEFMDSFEYIPREDGEDISWDQECEVCGKTFRVSFDSFNHNNGFECNKICKRHKYKWSRDTFDKHDLKYSISTTSNVYRCTKCGDIKFVYTKQDGTEYTKKEILDWKRKRAKEQFIKNHPEFNPIGIGVKTVEISNRETRIYISSNEPEGNEDLFKAINKLLKSKGFKILIRDQYSKDGQFKLLQRWHRDLNRGWLWCEAEFSRNSVKYEFFQNVYLEDKRENGRYGFNKYELMDLKMKTEFRSVRKLIENYVHENCNVINKPVQIRDFHGYVDKPKEIDKHFPGRVIKKYSAEWNDKSQGKDKNGVYLHTGVMRAAYDNHGRLWYGNMYDRCGTYKYMVHNDKTYSLFAARECFELKHDTPRRILPENSERRLEFVLSENIKNRNFRKCEMIQRVIDKLGEKS